MPGPLKYTTVCEIIDRVQSSLDWQNQPLRKSDMVDWIGQAIKRIGTSPMFKSRITGIDDGSYPTPILKIENYRITLPCDCYQLFNVLVGSSPTGPFYATRSATGSFDTVRGDLSGTTINPATNTYPPAMGDKIQFVADIFSESYTDAFTRLNTNPSLNSLLDSIFINKDFTSGGTNFADEEITHTLNTPYLEFSIRDGYVMLTYKAIATDANGYPYVPDIEVVKEACYWYVNMKLTYAEWRNGKVRDAVYYDACGNWGLFRNKSKGELNMPSGDEWQSILNVWVRMLPQMNEYESSFKYIGQQERLYNS